MLGNPTQQVNSYIVIFTCFFSWPTVSGVVSTSSASRSEKASNSSFWLPRVIQIQEQMYNAVNQ